MNNLFGQGKGALKKKILMWLAGLLAPAIPFILVMLIIIIVIIIIFAPLTMAKESSESSGSNDVGFFEKFNNFLSGNGWTSDEQAFFEIMQKNNLNCKQSTLVTATILYYYQFNVDTNLDYGVEPSDEVQQPTESESSEDQTQVIPPSENMYDDVPYGQILPDLKRLVKKIKKGNTAYEEYVKNTFLKQSPYNELIDFGNEQESIDKLYEEIKAIADTIECRISSNYGSATCAFNVDGGETATDLKVRLLRCGNADGNYSTVNDVELIDFEKYVTGVVYMENGGGPYEALKTQAVAVRSYTLTRGQQMGGTGIGRIENIDGQWIVSIRACVADQAYCDPDTGCWSNNKGGGQYTVQPDVDATMYPGEDTSKVWHRPPLPEDSPIRKAVEETTGEVLINSDNNIIPTGYLSDAQISWNNSANAGNDYFEILMGWYSGATSLASNCTLVNGNSSGDFANWKQYDPNWKNVSLGSSTIGAIGCAATSVAIQIANSGTEVLVSDFNPGTFVEEMTKNGGFVDNRGNPPGNNINWQKANSVAPNFGFYKSMPLSGSKIEKANAIKNEISKGNRYLIMSVKKGDRHWVAINYVDGENVYMFDPGSEATSVWDKYPDAISMTNRVIVYQVTN